MAFEKANVGDQIKIVRVAYEHNPGCCVGDVLEVKEVDEDCVTTTSENVFYDDDLEYEIM